MVPCVAYKNFFINCCQTPLSEEILGIFRSWFKCNKDRVSPQVSYFRGWGSWKDNGLMENKDEEEGRGGSFRTVPGTCRAILVMCAFP